MRSRSSIAERRYSLVTIQIELAPHDRYEIACVAVALIAGAAVAPPGQQLYESCAPPPLPGIRRRS